VLFYGAGSGTGNNGNILRIVYNGSWSYSVIASLSSSIIPVSSSSPNGLAYDSSTGRLYMGSFGGNPPSFLYFLNLTNNAVTQAGQLVGSPGSGAIWSGSYWYISQRSDNLRRVTLDPSTGMMVSDTLYANITGGSKLFDLGDIDFAADGTLYFTAKVVNAQGTILSREFSHYDLVSKVYTLINPQGATGAYNQMSRGADGNLYNHDTTTGQLTVITAANGQLSSSVLVTPAVTDLASVSCQYLDLNGASAAGVNTVEFFMGGQPISLVSSDAVAVGVSLITVVTGFTASLTGCLDGSSEVLSVSPSGSIAVTYNPSLFTLSSSTSATLQDYMATIRTLSYLDTAEVVTPGRRSGSVRLTLASGQVLEAWIAVDAS